MRTVGPNAGTENKAGILGSWMAVQVTKGELTEL